METTEDDFNIMALGYNYYFRITNEHTKSKASERKDPELCVVLDFVRKSKYKYEQLCTDEINTWEGAKCALDLMQRKY